MDVELAIIAEKLQLRLPYLRGDKNDKRMWTEFLQRLIADSQKCFQQKSGSDYLTAVDAIALLDVARRLLVSWGNKGSHSIDLVRPEAEKLIDACEKALTVFHCRADGCQKPVWFADVATKDWVQCQCGQLRWLYGKA
jgi:hypothetical protein